MTLLAFLKDALEWVWRVFSSVKEREEKKVKLKLEMAEFNGFGRFNMMQGVMVTITNLSLFSVTITAVYIPDGKWQKVGFDTQLTKFPNRLEPGAVETFPITFDTLEYNRLPESIRAIVETSTGYRQVSAFFVWKAPKRRKL